MTRVPSARPGARRPLDGELPDPIGLRQREAPALEGQRHRHDVPSAVDLADAERVGHAHAGVEGCVRAFAAHRVHRVDLDPRCVERHQEHREALVLGELGIGPGQQEHVGGFVGQGGEHLLAVDHPFVAVAHRTRLGRGDVGAGVGLGVPEGEDDVPGQRRRYETLLLLVGPDGADGAGDHDGLTETVGGDAGEAQLVAHRGHLHGVAALTAVLLGPRRRDPALRAQRSVELPVVRRPGVVGALDHLGTEVLAQELAHLLAERVAALAEPEVDHCASAVEVSAVEVSAVVVSGGPKSASARLSAPRRGSPSNSGHALARR